MPAKLGRSTTGPAAVLVLACAMCGFGQAPQPGISVRRIVGMEYPPFARMAVLQGKVELAATVSFDGTVKSIRVLSGPEPLASPAKETLSKWLFTGCRSQASECELRFVFTFVLSGSCTPGARCPTEFQVDLPNEVRVKSETYDSVIY